MSASGAPVLSDRPVNTSSPKKSMEGSKSAIGGKTMDYHRQALQNKLNDDSAKDTYVSPSDNIVSPCTAKLSSLKNKHFMKAKPQNLFGKKSTLSSESSFDDSVTSSEAESVEKKA